MRKAIPWSTRRFFASNSAKMQELTTKRRKLKAMKDQQAPINTMEALKDAFTTQDDNKEASELNTSGDDVGLSSDS